MTRCYNARRSRGAHRGPDIGAFAAKVRFFSPGCSLSLPADRPDTLSVRPLPPIRTAGAAREDSNTWRQHSRRSPDAPCELPSAPPAGMPTSLSCGRHRRSRPSSRAGETCAPLRAPRSTPPFAPPCGGVRVAAQVLAAETVSPLGEAAAELAEMVQQSPDPLMLSGADVTPVAATGPTVTSTASATDPAAAPATAGPASAPATAEPAAAAGPTTDLRLEEGALGRMPERPAAETLAALDLETSARMLDFAQHVSELTEQVKAASDVVTAELVAAEQAAAEQAAQQAAAAACWAACSAASINRKIGLANASVNGQIPREVLCGVAFDSDTLLRCDAARALEQLNAAYRAHFGQNLSVTSSYRDYDGQVEARNTRGGLAATPGTSNHGRGLAADLA